MKIIIELDGVVADMAAAHYAAHRQVTEEIGWSCLDQPTFWRLTRSRGSDANFLAGAKPFKIKTYHARFDDLTESDEFVAQFAPQEAVAAHLRSLAAHGEVSLVTFGTNTSARERFLAGSELGPLNLKLYGLNADPRRRPAELLALVEGDARCIIVAASDPLVRAASSAQLLAVAVASGAVAKARLHQAGADVAHRYLLSLVESMNDGAADLIRAGLLPPSLS